MIIKSSASIERIYEARHLVLHYELDSLAGRAFETFYMPSVLNPVKGNGSDSLDHLEKFSQVVEKKIRNLEKRKVCRDFFFA